MPDIAAPWWSDGSCPPPSVTSAFGDSSAIALAGRRVLVLEDEFIIARDWCLQLGDRGASVVGPMATVDIALRAVDERRCDCAIIDIDLRGLLSYAVADRLIELDVPFVFSTGYDRSVVPARYSDIIVCEKPLSPVEALAMVLVGTVFN